MGSTSNSTMERDLVRLQHSHDKVREITRDLGFDAARLLRTNAQDDPILCTSFGRLCQVVSTCLGHVDLLVYSFLLILFLHMSYAVSIPPCMERSFINC